MNNLFIHPENQELLWNIISKTQLSNNTNREHWFRNCIQHFYDKIQNENLVINDKVSLENINKNVLSYMINNVYQSQQLQLQHQSNLPIITPSINNYSGSYMNMNMGIGKEEEKLFKQEQFNNAFGERQKQYENMFAKPVIPEINFTEKLDDGPISNMEELIQLHLKDRENEIQKYLAINKIIPKTSSENIIITEKIDNCESSPNQEIQNINNNTQNITLSQDNNSYI
jgi:hypothetical protein